METRLLRSATLQHIQSKSCIYAVLQLHRMDEEQMRVSQLWLG